MLPCALLRSNNIDVPTTVTAAHRVAQNNGTLRDDFTIGDSSEKQEEIDVPNGMVGLIIGKGGENIRDLQVYIATCM